MFKRYYLRLVIAVFVFGSLYLVALNESKCNVLVTVIEKESTISGYGKNTSNRYLIFTKTETFENTDEWITGKFNSSDLYSKLKPGKTYYLRVIGWRIPFLSMYRNIIEIKKVNN